MDASIRNWPLSDISNTFNENVNQKSLNKTDHSLNHHNHSLNGLRLTKRDVTSIVNFVAKHANAFKGPAIVKKKQSKLPYTIAYTPASKEILVLFKKHGPILGEGEHSLVTTGLSLTSHATVAVKSSFAVHLGRNEYQINKILSKRNLKDMFVITDDFFIYNSSLKLDKNRSIKVLNTNSTPLTKSVSCDNHNIDREVLVKSLQKAVCIFEKHEMDLVGLLETRELSLKDKVYIASSIAHGLGILHKLGIVHLDIKPDNILMVDLIAKIADFGFAAFRGQVALAQGTAKFWAPEVFLHWIKSGYLAGVTGNSKINLLDYFKDKSLVNYLQNLPDFTAAPSADIWSFGMTLLTLIDPNVFYGFPIDHKEFLYNTDNYVARMLSRFNVLEEESLESLFELIGKCLKRNPNERITAIEAFRQLENIHDILSASPESLSEDEPDYFFL